MKALVYTQPNEMQILDRSYPSLDTEEVVLKIESVGICGSDMHAFHGHDPRRKPGLVLGHEFAGTIAETRSSLFTKGQRVTGNPLITCGHCEYCLQGRNNLCANRTMVGMTRPGAFAEYMSIPASSLIVIPEGLSLDAAALTEPAATAVHAINLSMRALQRPIQECRVLILGGGAIGMLSALLLKHYGVDDLTVAEVNPLRRKAIVQHVGCKTLNPIDEKITENSVEFVMDCVGAVVTRNTALAAVKPGGVMMHVGLQDWASEIDMRKLTLAEITLLGTYTYSTVDLQATVNLLARNAFGDLSWVEKRSLDDGPQAFSDLHAGKTAAAKVLLKPF
ncbi:galactitol-1-phosphate 5-dehydrogenase [Polynucleobacter sp. AP-Latsch-80-C2]|jgi:alcohol dehydrogenase|uniref:galactitol-1-phosphate 5-dehydrogenase n=1 Tax=Polynucleobacter sp. AP-Latsch-80-C2 TaxID=2576931 RepID=UPI001C0B4AA5|nr:galactitol-1-phosphate 5-dehydrogenase [Polynucleobacter sp. AP-Latsch-80-C2]MBU3623133.1 galactitol-1-phosphate 5-dehydrogenase [Polynucleobacter sp. AP-Latsch-80-C2]